MSNKYNPYSTQLFKLEVIHDASEHGPIVQDTRDTLHGKKTVPEDESRETDESERD